MTPLRAPDIARPPVQRRAPASRAPGGRGPVAAWGAGAGTSVVAASADRGTRIQLFRDLNRTAGNGAASRLARSLALQREGADDPYAEETGTHELANGRFTPHKRLQEIANGGAPLSRRDRSGPVKAVQTALLDIGYSLLRYKNDGSFGGETAEAIAQFRTDRGITEGEGFNTAAMRVLDTAAPPPGKAQEHYLDYSRLFADGRLDVTIAIGYDEGQTHFDDLAEARAWFRANKLARQGGGPAQEGVAAGGEAPKPDEDAETRKGLSVPETWKGTKRVTYPTTDGTRVTKDIALSVTLVPPGTGGKAAFAKGLNESELTLYSGHARMGIGPDFDADKSPYENFVLGVGSALHKAGRVKAAGHAAESHYVIDKKNDLEAMKAAGSWDPERYRVWFFNACSSIAYMDELRGGLLPEKMDRHNVDLFGTTQEVPIAAGLKPVFANLEGILAAQTMEAIVAEMQRSSLEALRKKAESLGYSEAKIAKVLKEFQGGMFLREGAGDNPVAASP